MVEVTYATIRRRAVLYIHALEIHHVALGVPHPSHQLCFQGKFYVTWP